MVIVARYFPNAAKLSLWRFEMRKILVFMMLSGVAFGQSGNRTNDPINAQSVNYVKFVGVGNYSTVQLALTDACAQNGGFGVVEIEQGATPADAPTLGGTASYTINGCTNSSGGVLIRDERSSAGANCYVYSNSTTYVQGACSSSSSSGYLLTLAKVNAVTTFGTFNTTLGSASLPTSSTGSSNSAYGYSALGSLTTGQNNIAVGAFSLNSDITASDNTAVGVDALFDVTGIENTAIGWQAGNSLTSGTTSTFVGYNAEPAGATDTNETVVGGGAIGNGSNTATIGNSSVTSGYIGSNQICLVTGTGCKAGFITNPMTTLGDTIYGGASGVPTRLAGVTTNTVTGYIFTEAPSGSAVAPTWSSFQSVLNLASVPAANVASGALVNGMTATTQSAADNSTKLATTAYADRAASATGNPFATGVQVTGPYGSAAATSTGNLDFNSGTTRLVSYGANSSTIGGFNINGGTSTGAITSYMNAQTALTGWVNFPQGGNFANSANVTYPFCVGGGASTCNAFIDGSGNVTAAAATFTTATVGVGGVIESGSNNLNLYAGTGAAVLLRSNSHYILTDGMEMYPDTNAMTFGASTAPWGTAYLGAVYSGGTAAGNLVCTNGSGCPGGISNPITSATGGSGTGTVACASAACTNLRGNYTVAGGTFATGTLLALVWPTTTNAYVCSATVLNNATGASIGYHSIATATGMNITSLTAVTGLSVDIDYSCQP